MSNKKSVLAIDQGTTSTRAMVFDQDYKVISISQKEFPQIYPGDGWVEHDPEKIWQSVIEVTQQAMAKAARKGYIVESIGITNQRETSVVWDRETGKAIYNAIVWQDRRTSDTCRQMKNKGMEEDVQNRTGLLLDPYFSATKVAWILDNNKGARERSEKGELAFGTIDSFLIWKLTSGQSHTTDATNASRTNLYNIHSQQWDDDLLDWFNVPTSLLPQVKDCSAHFGDTDPVLFGRSIPITGVAGDQQAASIGQCCFQPGSIKSTYGTGCFVMMNTGDKAIQSQNRLLTTVAYRLDGEATYAIEGSIFIAGAAVQWLRDGIDIINHAADTEEMARSVADNSGVYVVPAFTGLGVPYWEPDVRGAIFGISRSTGKKELVRATLESICYLTSDLFSAMERDGIKPESLRVDGGMVANNWLLQFLSNILDMKVLRPGVLETTALGAAYLAGKYTGFYPGIDQFTQQWLSNAEFNPEMNDDDRRQLLAGWHDAVKRIIAPKQVGMS